MADIRILVVADGPYLDDPTTPKDGISFAPKQDATDDTFTVSEFIYLLKSSQTPSFAVDTAHRRLDRAVASDSGTRYPTYENFNFKTTTDINQYDVIWLFGYEGWNYGDYGTPIGPDEVTAIASFMGPIVSGGGGGGIFATGDHSGMGSNMCGQIPRVRSMRKWFGRSGDIPAGYPGTAVDYSGAPVTTVNRPGASVADPANVPHPLNPGDPSMNRADTLQSNSNDTSNAFQFEDQSDATPQTIQLPGGIAHPILQGSIGSITRFPDHMHEGEVVTPAAPIDGGEYPNVGGFQPLPEIIATGNIIGNHATNVDQPTCIQINFATDATYTVANTIGVLCAYDGRGAGVGRVVTDSSFHHYLDLNLNGDPCGSTPDRMAGFGPALTAPAAGGILADLQAFYINTATWLAKPNPNFYFVTAKSTFGADESSTGTSFPAFWLSIEGYTLAQVQAALASSPPAFAGAFANLDVISAPGAPVTDGANSQRILIPYNVQFSATAMNAFPDPGNTAKQLLLDARFLVSSGSGSTSYSAETNIELTAGANPYFQNVDPAQNNAFYLSQDLHVFTMTPSQAATIPGIPGASFPNSGSQTRTPSDANSFIVQVLSQMNGNAQFTDPGNADPFAQFPTTLEANGDSSVNPVTNVSGQKLVAYNFAIARVRLRGTAGATTNPKTVRVFFRLFLTQTNDTDFQPSTTYSSKRDAVTNLPIEPLPAPDGSSQPFFATGTGNGDYFTQNVNNFALTVNASGDTSAYFGCHLNVYDAANNSKYPGTHHCIVAEIADEDTPIVNSNGITLSPETSDKLAQRNLQVTLSGNPGPAAAHRIPQTFDTRPSVKTSAAVNTLPGYPDELMIEWGDTPLGSKASIYWPGVPAIDIVRLAMLHHSASTLGVADKHTVEFTVNSAVTYVPIPFGTAARFAGLFTIDLPIGVKAGREYKVVVRRISTRQAPPVETIQLKKKDETIELKKKGGGSGAHPTKAPLTRDWRYIVGTFQVTIPVRNDEDLILPEEDTLAIMKWRLLQMHASNRWYPVLLRYIHYLSGRVDGFGGNAKGVLPSPIGVPWPKGSGSHPGPIGVHEEEFTGKVEGVVYDRFGDFRGFYLLTEAGVEREFHSTEAEIERLVHFAWIDRVVVSVVVVKVHPDRPVSIILRRAPLRLEP